MMLLRYWGWGEMIGRSLGMATLDWIHGGKIQLSGITDFIIVI